MICRFTNGVGGSTLLDLNDATTYWYLDGSEFPLPEVLYTWVENSQADGKRLADWRLGGNTITLKLLVRGTSNADTYDKLRVLMKRLLKEGTLEVRMYGADTSVFYHTYPALPKLPDFAKKFVIDQNAMSNVTIEIPVDPVVKTSVVTLDVIKSLGPNDDFGSLVSGTDADNWTETDTGGGAVTYGSNSCTLDISVALGDDLAEIKDEGYLAVDSSLHYQCIAPALEVVPGWQFKVKLLCYDVSDNLLSTLTLVDTFDIEWPFGATIGDACEFKGTGVINPVGGSAPAFPAGTTKVKRQLYIYGTAGQINLSGLWFGCTEYVPGYKVSGLTAFVIPGADILGDVPSKADVHLGVIHNRFTDLICGQRKLYSDDFNPAQKPTAGTPAWDGRRYLHGYQVVPALTELLDDPDFSEYTGSGTSADFTYWTETTYGTGTLEPLVDGVYALYPAVGDGAMLVSDKVVLDPTDTHLMDFQAMGYAPGSSLVTAAFYDGAVLVGTKVLYDGPPPGRAGVQAYILPDDCPAGTDGVTLSVFGERVGIGRYQSYFRLSLSIVTKASVVFPVEDHEGRYFVTAGFSYGGSTANGTASVLAALETSTGEEITPATYGQAIDPGDPNGDFKEVLLLDRLKVRVPVMGISDNADLSDIYQSMTVTPDSENAEDLWIDHIALIPYDRACTMVSGWADKDYLILDSRSTKQALVSLDGTLEKALAYRHSGWQGPPDFEADPDGMNLVVLAVKDNSDDQELTPLYDLSIVYNPAYLLVT
jgi:hypothetical protein